MPYFSPQISPRSRPLTYLQNFINMAPLHITPMDASASPSDYIPAPTSSANPFYDDRPPIVVPDWFGWFGLGVFACIIIFQFYWTLTRSPNIALE
ncbi:hypothetical protein DFH09DRAFT_1369535, partial [Mycena vulgaris]